MTRLTIKDELLDAQLLRTMGATPAGGADVGECLVTAARLKGTDLARWYDEWSATAERLYSLAEVDARNGDRVSARGAYLRASSYFRTAGVMLMTNPVDPRLVESNRRQTEAFRLGAERFDLPPECIEIPYEGTTLPGYFFPAGSDGAIRPTLILTGGYDGTAEELFFFTGAAALERGYHVLTFDGPGQGAALLQKGLVLRPDWEHVIGPVVDFALGRPDVDPDRIALIGLSLGAHLAPRAAAHEHRLAACIADCGSFDLFESALGRMPSFLRDGYADGRPLQTSVIRRIISLLAAKPTAGWALRRGQLVHGVESPIEYLDALREYSLRGHADKIRCPTFVCNAEGDDIGESAPELFRELRCQKEFVTFASADGAGDHCEAGARTRYHAQSFAWLDALLQPEPLTSSR